MIVVDQMLTGFDSKWVNTLYMDKLLKFENIIQAFSRTNRLFGPDKPFGSIRYYRYPNTMEEYINKAVALYSGNKPLGLFVEHLDYNLEKMNGIFADISHLFTLEGIADFSHLPDDVNERRKFAKLFASFNKYLEASKIQGFIWEKQTYNFENPKRVVEVKFEEKDFLILALRYKELFEGVGEGPDGDVPFDIESHLVAIDTGRIDSEDRKSVV